MLTSPAIVPQGNRPRQFLAFFRQYKETLYTWTDIIQVAAGYYHTVGLRSDGTAVAVGDNSNRQLNVGSWTDIIQVAPRYYHTVGLRSDGTAVAVGRNEYGQLDVGSWTDIIQVAAGYYHTVGLRSDGTAVAVGDNSYGQCSFYDWDLGVGNATGGILEGPIQNPDNLHTYYLLEPDMTWTEAEAKAVALGGHLVTINDAAEQDWVWSTFGRVLERWLWIGLNDVDVEGNFVWTSGEMVTYTNWSWGEPNDYGGAEDYGEMDANRGGTWNDLPDDGWKYRHYGVVEIDDSSALFSYGRCQGSCHLKHD